VRGPIDLNRWTPPGRETAEYAAELLRSTHLSEVRSAEEWLTRHPHAAVPALIQALVTPSAQPAAVLLGAIGGDEAIEPLIAAHTRGGEGLREAVERGLRLNGSPRALAALDGLDRA
jgi:hypothetical protein